MNAEIISVELTKTKDGARAVKIGLHTAEVVEGANNEGFDIRGIDINRLSIKTGKEAWPKVAHLLEVRDFTQPQSEEEIYDVVVLSDILSHVGNPMALLKNTIQVIKDDGFIYINIVNFGCKKAQN